MKRTILSLTTMASMAMAIITLTSCSSTPKGETVTMAATQKGVPGGTFVETHQVTATVTSIDTQNRKVTIVSPDGHKETVKCGPEIINFEQIHVGDQVKATVTSELVVAMANAAGPQAEGAALVALAPKGAKPGGVVAETQKYTATITAINLKRREATLRLPDGSYRTVPVRKDVDLSKRKVGEEVSIQVTVAMAIDVQKP